MTFGWSSEGLDELHMLVDAAIAELRAGRRARSGPLPAGGPEAARRATRSELPRLLPDEGGDPADVVSSLTRLSAAWAVDLAHPAMVARMQSPALAAAVAAELVAAVLNQGMQAWESGPAALELETLALEELAAVVGFPATAAGTLTSGGSASNLMGLLLARDRAVRERTGTDASRDPAWITGLRPVVMCGSATHFSIRRAAGILGLGTHAVTPQAGDGPLDPGQLDHDLGRLGGDVLPIAVVATAGATDLGTIDPLADLAAVCQQRGVWLHVDAAYGGGALFSPRLAPLLAGIELADSVSLDLHKFGWMPASSAVFLAREAAAFAPLATDASYLGSPDDRAAGYTSPLGRSLQATRRADALKIAVALGVLGRQGLAAGVEACHDVAQHAAVRIADHPDLELAAWPVLTTVVFRCLGSDPDTLNASVRRHLIEAGQVVVGRTTLRDRVFLKLVLLAPTTTADDLDALIDAIVTAARAT